MCRRIVDFRTWAVVVALAALGGAKAQTFPAGTSPGAPQCAAWSVLAPDPPKAQEPATQGASNTIPAAFKVPQPVLKPGATAEWSSKVEVTFDPPVEAHHAKCLESDVVLFLDHYPLGLKPIQRIRDDKGVVTLAFLINRPTASTQDWTGLLADLWASGGTRDVTVGIGVGNTEIGVAKEKLILTLGTGSPILAKLALVASLILLVVVWKWTKILQDRRDGPMSYSVSRLLLSCWVLTSICAVLMAVLRTGSMPSASENGLQFLLAISGATTGLSGFIDFLRKPENSRATNLMEDFFDDADGLAIHRVQIVVFNFLILGLVWRDMIQLGRVASIDHGWATLLGVSAMTFLFGKSSESIRPAIAADPPSPPSPA